MSSDHQTTRTDSAPAALGCSTICFRDQSLPDALASVRAAGFSSADLGALQGLCEHIPPLGSTAELQSAAAVVKRSGVTPTSLNADCGSFTHDRTQDVLARVERLCGFCSDAGVEMLILPCGGPERDDISVADQIITAAAGLAAAADLAAAAGVRLVVEAPHHFRLVNTLDRTRSLLAQLDERVGLVYDVSHVRAAGNAPAQAFDEFAARVAHIHLRDAVDGDIRRCIGAGDIDFPAVFAATTDAGYSRTYCLELETHDSPFASKADEVSDALRRLGPYVPALTA